MTEPKQPIEKIRKERFGIGLKTENLPDDVKAALEDKEKVLKDASKLAKEIHTKNPHFIFELIQNAEDNKYENSTPALRFVIDSDRLIIQNNETGFEKENVWALCGVGETTKRNKTFGYIGEKGIGFKSVFMVADKVQIYSNGFQFGFNYDKSDPVTMIVPEWIDEIPDFVDLNQTNIVLYLKPEIRNEIYKYLNEIHPSLLLFLRKLKVIEVEERDKNKIRNMELHHRDGIVGIVYDDRKSFWKVVKKLFDVPQNIDEERRRGVNETEIILAFPLKEDYSPNTSDEQFVFSFLPVRNYGFKFIIQADFLLPITREDIIKDNKWNEWLRDSIVEVFLEAVGEFKKNEKFRYEFYNYLPVEGEVTDEFFLPVVGKIYEKLKEDECILTEANKWEKPSEVLIGDEEIKKIIKNEDLKKFFGKEYLLEKIKAKKPILRKLGVKNISVDDLIRSIENTEWIKHQNEEWFACLFRYISKKKLSEEQLEQLKYLKIIKLENGELTSIDKGVVFFPLEKKEKYGFEGEIRVIKKRIVEIISKYVKEEKNSVFEFLKKLGLKQADPYEIIESHILPVYENDEGEQKDSKVLVGYIRYIKDNIDKYEKERDRRLNTNKPSWQPKEDPLKRLKKSLLIRIDKNDEGKEWYDKPENVYLPEIYGNENNLEKLFEEIYVNFVHPCYIEDDIERLDREIDELENKLKEKSKKWRKKHRKYVKKIEEQLNKLINKRDKKVEEWKEFLLKIGINEIPKIHIKRDSRQHTTYGGNVYKKEVKIYSSKEIISILEKKQRERNKKLLIILDRFWNYYSNFIEWIDYYFYYNWNSRTKKADWFDSLINRSRLPTTQNTLAKPSEVFLNKPEVREVLGDTVPYLAVKIKNEDFIKTLGINTQANVEGVLNYLKSLVEHESQDREIFEKLYKFLDEHFEEDIAKIKEEFDENPLILVTGTEKNYYRSKEVIWKDVSGIFGKNRIYLEKFYPKELKKFFVKELGISEKPTPKDYADVLCSISEKTEISDEDKKVIVRIYEELNRNLNPDKIENPISEEDWWEDFTQKSIFLIDRDEFWFNSGDIFINGNNEIYELFKDEENIGFLWIPEGYHPDKIKFFIKSCNLRYLSESVEIKPLVEGEEYSKDENLTQLIRSVILYVLRYLYWKENETYEKIKKNGVVEKIAVIEVYAVDNLRVEYSVKVNEWRIVSKEAERRCIYHNGSLYIKKNDSSIYDLAVEFSKAFGEIKGLDDFVMNIMNNLPNVESIMKAKNIGELPEEVRKVLRKINDAIIKRQMEMKIQQKEREEPASKEKKEKLEHEKEYEMAESSDEEVTKIGRDVFDEIKEKEWVPEISPEEAPIQTEDYKQHQEDMIEDDENKTLSKKLHAAGVSKSNEGSRDAENLSDKSKKDIGRWGEEYAFICIKNDMTKKYPYSSLVYTKQGFRLEKNDNIVAEVVWLNKNEESKQHYDIKITENGDEIYIEVKSTKEYAKDWFRVSRDQWKLMKEKEDKFYIYRVYGVGTENAKIKKICNPALLWKDGLLDAYPMGIEL